MLTPEEEEEMETLRYEIFGTDSSSIEYDSNIFMSRQSSVRFETRPPTPKPKRPPTPYPVLPAHVQNSKKDAQYQAGLKSMVEFSSWDCSTNDYLKRLQETPKPPELTE
jgi:hypothetical protein